MGRYGNDRVIEFFNLATGKGLQPDQGHPSPTHVTDIAFSPDGKRLATVGDDGKLFFWDLATAQLIRQAKVPPGVCRVAFSSDPKLYAIVRVTEEAPKERWDIHVELRSMPNDTLLSRGPKAPFFSSRETSLAFTPDGELLLAICDGGEVLAVRTKDGIEDWREGLPNARHVALTPDGSHLLIVDGRNICHVFKIKQDPVPKGHARVANYREEVHVWKLDQALPSASAFLPDGQTMAVPRALGNPGVVRLDWRTGKLKQEISQPPEGKGKFQVNALGPAGRFAAMACVDDQGRDLGCLVRDLLARLPRDRFFAVKSSGSTKAYVFSPDGRYLAVAGPGGLISLLRLEERKTAGAPVRVPTAEELAQRPNAADALKHGDVPELERAYVGGGDPKKAPPELVAVLADTAFRCPNGAGKPAFSPGGNYLAVLSEDRVLLYDPKTGAFLRPATNESMNGLSAFAFSPDGRRLATYQRGYSFVQLWDIATGKRGKTLGWTNSDHDITALGFSPDGSRLVGAAATPIDLRLRIWDLQSGRSEYIKSFEDERGMHAEEARMAPDHQTVFIRVTRPGAKTLFLKLSRTRERWERAGIYTGRGGAFFGKLFVFQNAGRIEFRDENDKVPRAFSSEVGDVIGFDAGRGTLIAGGMRDGSSPAKYAIRRWDLKTHKELTDADLELIPDARGYHLALSPDSATLAACRRDGKNTQVQVFDTATGKPRVPDPGHTLPVVALAFSPNGKQLASADERTMRVWDLATGRLLRSWPWDSSHGDTPQLAYSPDGGILATNGVPAQRPLEASTLALCRAADGRRLTSLVSPVRAVKATTFSPDGEWLAVAGPGKVWVARVADGKSLRILRQGEETRTLIFSPDSQSLITLDTTGLVTVWGLADGHEKRSWQTVHNLRQLVFLPDGRSLAGVGSSGEVGAWNILTGELRQNWRVTGLFGKIVGDTALSPAGRLLALQDRRGLVLSQPGAEPQR